MAKKMPAPEPPPPVAASRAEEGSAPRWPLEEVAGAWMGLPWMNVWMQAWTVWLQQWGLNGEASPAAQTSADDRRQPGLPWLPQFESTVIPLRRRDDLPGAEAAKVSMRLRVPAFPWAAGTSNVIAIDTVMPRPVAAADEPPPSRH